MHKFEKFINLSVNIYELNFYEDDNKWRIKLISIEVSKNDSVNRVTDLAFYKNHFVLIKKIYVFIGKEDNKFICRHCLPSYTTHNVLLNHIQICGQQEITSIKLGKEPYIYILEKSISWESFIFQNYTRFWGR